MIIITHTLKGQKWWCQKVNLFVIWGEQARTIRSMDTKGTLITFCMVRQQGLTLNDTLEPLYYFFPLRFEQVNMSLHTSIFSPLVYLLMAGVIIALKVRLDSQSGIKVIETQRSKSHRNTANDQYTFLKNFFAGGFCVRASADFESFFI